MRKTVTFNDPQPNQSQPKQYPSTPLPNTSNHPNGQGDFHQLNNGVGLSRLSERGKNKTKEFTYFSLYRKEFITLREWFILTIGFVFALGCGPLTYFMLRELRVVTNLAVSIEATKYPVENQSSETLPYCLHQKEEHSIFFPGGSKGYVNVTRYFAISFAIFAIGIIVCSMGCYICWDYVGRTQFKRICTIYYNAIVNDTGQLNSTGLKTSAFVNKILYNLLRTRETLGKEMAKLFILIAIAIGSFVISIQHGIRMTLVSLLVAVIIWAISFLVAYIHAKYFFIEIQSSKSSNHLAEEVIRNIKTVQTYGGEKNEFYKFCMALEQSKGNKGIVKRSLILGLINFLMWVAVFGGYALVFWFGSDRVIRSIFVKCSSNKIILTPGDFVIIFWGVLYGFLNLAIGIPTIEALFEVSSSIREIMPAIDKLNPGIGYGENRMMEGILNQPQFKLKYQLILGNIELKQVWFTYETLQNPLLANLNFNIKHGNFIGIVGPPKSGKSIFLKLLTKEIIPSSGSLYINGVSAGDVDTERLRNQIGFVCSDGGLFDLTIEENIRMGKPSCGHIQVINAAQLAGCHDRITLLKDGYRTACGPKGSFLNPGLRQQVAIARALVKNPTILLMDHPTRGLDYTSELWVQNSIQAIRKSSIIKTTAGTNINAKTCIIATRNVQSVINCDMIYVLNQGKIVDQGKHQDLMSKKNGPYYALSMNNNSNYSVDDEMNQEEEMKNNTNKEMSFKEKWETFKYFENTIYYTFRQSILYPEASLKLLNIQLHEEKTVKEIDLKPEDSLAINRKTHQNEEYRIFLQSGGTTRKGNRPNKAKPVNHKLGLHATHEHRVRTPIGRSIAHLLIPQASTDTLVVQENMWNKFSKKEIIKPTNPYLFEPQLTRLKTPSFWQTMTLASHSPALVIAGIVISILIGVCIPIFPITFGILIQQFFLPNSIIGEKASNYNSGVNDSTKQTRLENNLLNTCYWISLSLFISGLFIGILVIIQIWVLRWAGWKSVTHIRKRMFHCMLQQDASWFYDRQNSLENVMNKLNKDAVAIRYVTITVYGTVCQCISTLISAVVISFILPEVTEDGLVFSFQTTTLAIECTFLFVPILLSSFLNGWFLLRAHQHDSEELNEISKLLMEVVQNKSSILTCQLENYFQTRLQQSFHIHNKKSRCNRILLRIFFGLTQGLVFIGYGICIWFGARHNVPYYQSIIVAECLFFFLTNIGLQLSLIRTVSMIHESGKNILQMLERKSIVRDYPGSITMESCEGYFEFNNVGFWFPQASNEFILRDVNFNVKPNEMIALVGNAGAGRTTCLELGLRLYDPSMGTVSIDNIDLRNITISQLRANMALLETKPKLFKNLTIAQNIAYGDNTRKVSMIEIINAAKLAKVDQMISTLPKGYQTKVSSIFLSRGQKHGIALARALVRPQRQIIFLDETLDYLDEDSEKSLIESLESARIGKTCIVIATKLSTIKNADKIFLLDQSIIKEMGKHDELLNKKGLYYQIWNKQHNIEGIFSRFTENLKQQGIQSLHASKSALLQGPAPPQAPKTGEGICDVTGICNSIGLSAMMPNKKT